MLYKNSRLSSAMLGNSMLRQIGGSSTGMLTSALQGSSTRPVSKYDKTLQNALGSRLKSYTGIGGSAEGLRSAASALSSKAEDNVFDKARETGSSDELLRQAKAMVNGYNDTMKGLKGSSEMSNSVYNDMLGNAVKENSKALSEIGISVGRDNSLSIDEKKFQSAGIDKIEQTLGKGSGLTDRLSFVSEYVSRNAAANATRSLSTMGYGSGGGYLSTNYLSGLLGGGYNFFI